MRYYEYTLRLGFDNSGGDDQYYDVARQKRQLAVWLERLVSRYHHREFLRSDPLEFVHRFGNPSDQEAVALVSAVLAYGQVGQIRHSIEKLLLVFESIGNGPSGFVRACASADQRRRAQDSLDSFVHRFNKGKDVVLLLRLLGRSWQEYGSLGAHFCRYLHASDLDIGPALQGLIQEWRGWAEATGEATDSFFYFLTSPEKGSCCKRWCMFTRWMGRHDDLDPGLWIPFGLKAAQLVMPLDTHVARISRYLGLTARRSADWQAALEVTDSLRKFDPSDPTRYDFALSRLGILDLCQKRPNVKTCKSCEMVSACRP